MNVSPRYGGMLFLALTACVHAPIEHSAVADPLPSSSKTAATPTAAPVLLLNDVLADYPRLRRLSAGELAREQTRLALRAQQAPTSDALRLHYALSLCAADNPDLIPKTQQVIESILRSNTDDSEPWRATALVLNHLFAQNRRLDENVEKLQTQLRDEQRRSHDLRNKLEALKAIERSLTLPYSQQPASGSK